MRALLALRRPALSAELVQARRRRILGDVVGRAIPLELVDAIERHVEPIAALVLDDRDFDRALPDEDRLDAAIDADAVLEMHDVVAVLERHRVERRGAADVPARAANAPLAAEDLVIGENAKTGALAALRRNEKAAIEHADRQRRRRRDRVYSSLSSSSRRSHWPSLSQRMIVGMPSRTRRLSCLMSRSTASGGRNREDDVRLRLRLRSTAMIVPSFCSASSVTFGESNSSSRSGTSSPRRRARSM